MHSARLASTLLKDEEQYEEITLLFVTWPNIRLFNFFSFRLSKEPFLNSLLTTPPHLKYAVTLPCNLPLSACFADIKVSQVSVATYKKVQWARS